MSGLRRSAKCRPRNDWRTVFFKRGAGRAFRRLYGGVHLLEVVGAVERSFQVRPAVGARRLPTVSVVYILRPRGYRPQGGQFRLAVEDGPTQQVWFREIRLWEMTPEPGWDQVPGLMALSPLCHQQRGPQDVLTHAVEAIVSQTPDAIQRGGLLTTLAIFGKLAFPHIDAAGLIGKKPMKESKVILQFQEEARVEAQRKDTLQVLEIKFGARAVTEFASSLDSVNDSERLSHLHRLAVQASSLKQFRDRFEKT